MAYFRKLTALAEALVLACLILLGAALRFDVKAKPIDFDAGLFAYTAQRVANDATGETHYTDFFDNMPPLIYSIYRLSFALFGRTPLAVHMTSVLPDLAILLLILLLGRTMISWRAGLWAAAMYSLSYVPLRLSHFGEAENAAMATALLGLLIYLRGMDSEPGRLRMSLIAAGACFGLGSMIKQPVVFLMIAVGLHMTFRHFGRWRMMPAAAPRFAYVALGFAAILALTAIALLSQGILYKAVYASFIFPMKHQGFYGMELSTKWREFLFKGVILLPFWCVLGAVGLVRAAALRERGPVLAGICAACVAIFYLWTGDFFQHYLLYALPIVALLAGAAIDWALAGKWPAPLRIGLALAVIGMIMYQHEMIRRGRYGYGGIENELTGNLDFYYRQDSSLPYQQGLARCMRNLLEDKDLIFTTTPAYAFLLDMENHYTQFYVAPLTKTASGNFKDLDKYLDEVRFALVELSRRDYLPQIERLERDWKRVECYNEGSSPNSILIFENPSPKPRTGPK